MRQQQRCFFQFSYAFFRLSALVLLVVVLSFVTVIRTISSFPIPTISSSTSTTTMSASVFLSSSSSSSLLSLSLPSFNSKHLPVETRARTTSLYSTKTSIGSVFPISMRQALIERSKLINSIGLVTDNEKALSDSSPTGTKGQYTTAGWSNRAATIVTPVYIPVSTATTTSQDTTSTTGGAIYTIDRPFYWNNIDVGCRATVIELPCNNNSNNKYTKPDLVVHSPVGLDGPLIRCLQEIGNVKYIVSTNYEHTKFIQMWYQHYCSSSSLSTSSNNVYIWGCPGLMERIPNIPWTGEIPYGYRPISWQYDRTTPSEIIPQPTTKTTTTTATATDDAMIWDTTLLQPLHLNIEHNPFTQKAFFNEIIFYHTPSKALLITDLYWNYPTKDGRTNKQYQSIKQKVYGGGNQTSSSDVVDTNDGNDDAWELAPIIQPIPIGSTLWKFGMDQIYAPFYNNYMITNRTEYTRIINHILYEWDIEMIIPAHGDIIRGTRPYIQAILQDYFNKYL